MTKAVKTGDEVKFIHNHSVMFGRVIVSRLSGTHPVAQRGGGTAGYRVKTEDNEVYFVPQKDILEVL